MGLEGSNAEDIEEDIKQGGKTKTTKVLSTNPKFGTEIPFKRLKSYA